MSPNLVMSLREREYAAVLREVVNGHLSVREATEHLQVSRRQVFRLLRRYRSEGDAGLIHRLRGRPSNRGYPRRLKARVLELYWRPEYRDYGPTLFSEVLASDFKIAVHHETLRRWLMGAGGSNVQRRKRPHRSKRTRRQAIGEMLQFDGSVHDWFEGRGPECTLLHLIDDAIGRVFLRFVPSENTADCLRVFRAYCERYGVPRSLYTDRGGVFYRQDGALTDFGRALHILGVTHICANSPEAKGRVERGNRTHQDRLIKALRRKGISTIAQANRFLERSYLEDHNRRFALPHDGLPDLHQGLDSPDLDHIFCFQTERCLRRDYTITLDGTYIQILKATYALPRPRQYLVIRRYLDDSLHLFHGSVELQYQILPRKPLPRGPARNCPPPTHPWRLSRPIGKAKRRLR